VIVNKPEDEERAVWNEKQCRQFDKFLKTCIMRSMREAMVKSIEQMYEERP
jgi:hypothetical protein